MPAVALTDHGSLAGAVELYRETGKHGVKPLLGCEVYVTDDRRALETRLRPPDPSGRVERGLREPDQARLDAATSRATTTSRASTGTSSRRTRRGSSRSPGCLSGRVCKALEDGNRREAEAELGAPARHLRRRLDLRRDPGRRARGPAADQPRRSPSSRRAIGLPLVATGDVHYLRHEDARAHEALLCIQSGDSLSNPNRWRFDTDQFYFKTPEEMAADFADYPEAVRAHARDRRALHVDDGARPDPAAALPDARRPRRVRLPRRALREGPRAAATGR